MAPVGCKIQIRTIYHLLKNNFLYKKRASDQFSEALPIFSIFIYLFFIFYNTLYYLYIIIIK